MAQDMGVFEKMFDDAWSGLSVLNRSKLLADLGINGENQRHLEGQTMEQILLSGQDNLPGEIRGRLLMAHNRRTGEFSLELYNQNKEAYLGHKQERQ